jgi:ketosteroid isomerase-like protein
MRIRFAGPLASWTLAPSRTLVLAILAASAAALASPPDLSAQSEAEASSDVAEEIKAILVDMWDAVEQGDLERYASHLHDDFTSFGETDTYLNEGKAYEVRSYGDYLTRVRDVHTEMHQPEVTVRGDVAWITYYWTDAGYQMDGTRFTSRGKSTRIFVREGGRWLCIHGHYTLAD